MNITPETFKKNLLYVKRQILEICQRCDRDPAEIKIMAVTKNRPLEAIQLAAQNQLYSIGENKVQEAAKKKPQTKATLPWELIGHLQTNKAKLAIATFDRIQTLDSIKLVNILDRYCQQANKIMPVLLQINPSNDPNKSGVTSYEQTCTLLETILNTNTLKPEGLMTIAPLSNNPDITKKTFSQVRSLRDFLAEKFAIPLQELSMGMTNDLIPAIEAGSTCIRIGSALYSQRD
jgi:PLP dependent protein